MTVTGMTKSMQTSIYFVFWKQKLETVYAIIFIQIILFQCFDLFCLQHFIFSKNIGNRDDIMT